MIRASEQSRPGVAARRERWRGEVMPGLDPQKQVFLDETAAKTDLTRPHGYAAKGERLYGERLPPLADHHLRRRRAGDRLPRADGDRSTGR